MYKLYIQKIETNTSRPARPGPEAPRRPTRSGPPKQQVTAGHPSTTQRVNAVRFDLKLRIHAQGAHANTKH